MLSLSSSSSSSGQACRLKPSALAFSVLGRYTMMKSNSISLTANPCSLQFRVRDDIKEVNALWSVTTSNFLPYEYGKN